MEEASSSSYNDFGELEQVERPDEPLDLNKNETELLLLDDMLRSDSPSLGNQQSTSRHQPIRHLKLMEQPSPTGSTDSEVAGTHRRKMAKKVNKRNERGETPLHIASKKGHLEVCRELINAGADVNVSDNAGWTPLHEASMYHNFEVAELLLLSGANPNLQSIDGETPLHDSASIYNVRITWLLLRHGANREARNKQDLTPLEVVLDSDVEKGDEEFARKEATRNLLLSEQIPSQCPFANVDENHVKRPTEETDNCEFNPSTSGDSPPTEAFVTEDQRILFTPETSQSPDILTAVVIPGLLVPPTDTLDKSRMATPISEELSVSISSPMDFELTAPVTEPLIQLAPNVYLSDQINQQTTAPSAFASTFSAQIQPIDPAIQENSSVENTGQSSVGQMLQQPSTSTSYPTEEPQRSIEAPTVDKKDSVLDESVAACAIDTTGLEISDESSEVQQSPAISLNETDEGRSLEVGGSNDELTNDSLAKTPPFTEEHVQRTQSSASNSHMPAEATGDSEFDRLNIPETESGRFPKTAIWKMRASSQQPRYSPANSRYDFSEEGDDSRDEVRSESGYQTKPRSGRGRGRGGRPTSGSTTPMNTERRKPGRGRGGRGRGRGSVSTRYENVVNTGGDDPEDGTYSPDFDGDYDREYSAPPPASKRLRLDDMEQQDSGTPTGYNSPDHEESEDGLTDYGSKRVAPMVIRLPKKQEDEAKSQGRKGIRKGQQGEADDAQRMTRSKVKQTGGQLDDGDIYLRKKRGRPAQSAEINYSTADGESSNTSNVKPEDSEDNGLSIAATHSLQVIAHNPHDGPINFKKKLTRRFLEERKDDVANRQIVEEKDKNFRFRLFAPECDYKNLLKIVSPAKYDSIPEELQEVLNKYLKERQNLLQRCVNECVRMEISAENDYKICRNRHYRLAPKTSVIRALNEDLAGNPNILDEPMRLEPIVDFNNFKDAWEKKLAKMYHQHAEELKTVYETHIQYMRYTLKANGTLTQFYQIKDYIPQETISQYISGLTNMTEYV